MKNIPDENEREQIWSQFDALGEAEVRTAIKLKRYHGGRLALAERWLEVKDQEREVERERVRNASNSESLRIARSAKNAAWAAVIMAAIAAIIAAAAMVISYLAFRASR
jgi:type IV secretory pathway component VirB8